MGWFRHDNRMRHDPKIRALDDSAYRLWNALMELASEMQLQGTVHFLPGVPFSDEQLADEAKIPVEAVRPSLETMKRFRMIEERTDCVFVTNFAKRQYQSDVSTGRVRAFRERQRSQQGNDDETFQEQPSNDEETPPDTDTDNRLQREEDIVSSPPSAEKRRRTAKKRDQKAPDPFNVAAQSIVDRLDRWLKGKNTPGVGDWGAAVKMTANALKGKGGPPIPPEEAEEALSWGTKHQHWRSKILSGGPKLLREVWADWKGGGASGSSGNRYQDHTQTQPTGESLFK